MEQSIQPGSVILFQYIDLAGFLRSVESVYQGDRFETAFDGSSVPGFRPINDSDLFLVGDPSTLRRVPWIRGYYRILSEIYSTGGERYNRDPRYIAGKVQEYLRESYGFEALVGAELEFFVLDGLELDVTHPYSGISYSTTSEEHPWEANSVGRLKAAYHTVEPVDKLLEYRSSLRELMATVGYSRVLETHHEVALGQIEVDLEASNPLVISDNIITLKWVAHTLAMAEGKIAVFMPKPIYGDNGSGMHLHLSLWSNGKNTFYEEGGTGISQVARSFIAGILEHAESLAALVAPTTNSYRRLVPGYEAPVYVSWGYRNRSAMIRVPAFKSAPAARIEFRTPDPSANPYLAIAGTLLAGLDGVRKRLDPGDPIDKNVYHISPSDFEKHGIRMLPKSLDDALDALESDNEYLKPVFDDDIIEAYIEMKRKEAETIRTMPHPYEFYLYGAV
ncbi:MAG: type I glutamate--ammonia ligase [Desulfurococcales archaeon]|nr:type I glutamate--ammonia ligase [Desulfurococcales archaeon]